MSRTIATTLMGAALVMAVVSASASPITIVKKTNFWGQITAGVYVIAGNVVLNNNDALSISYTTGGKPATTTSTLAADATRELNIPADATTTITVNDTSEGTSATIVADGHFNPPGQTVNTPLVVSAGSATLGGSTFALSGAFSTIATGVVYDPTSVHYGDLSGFLPASAFNIQGTGNAGSFVLSLNGNSAWTVNLSALWGQDPTGGLATGFSTPLSGTVTSGGNSSPFSGTATGSVTFFDDGTETINATFDFASGFGPINGTLTASGESFLVTPEPSTLTLFGFSAVGLLRFRLRRKITI